MPLFVRKSSVVSRVTWRFFPAPNSHMAWWMKRCQNCEREVGQLHEPRLQLWFGTGMGVWRGASRRQCCRFYVVIRLFHLSSCGNIDGFSAKVATVCIMRFVTGLRDRLVRNRAVGWRIGGLD